MAGWTSVSRITPFESHLTYILLLLILADSPLTQVFGGPVKGARGHKNVLLRGRMALGQFILKVSGKRELSSPEWRAAEISSQ